MRWLYGLTGAILLVGCNGAPVVESSPAADIVTAPRSTVTGSDKLTPPDYTIKTSLRMIRKGDEVRIGDSVDSALRAFLEEKNSYKVTEMPAGWKDQNFSCQGWDNGTTGFAAIVYDEKVALGLWHEDRVDESRLQEILADYDRFLNIAPRAVTGSRVRYWFWEQGPHRLMISAVQIPIEGMSVTIALGDSKVMDVLRMNLVSADRDQQAAEKLFQEGMKARQGS